MADYIPRSSLEQARTNSLEKREKLDPVVTAKTKNKQKTTWEKIKEEFISEDGKSVGDYLLFDVLIPAAKRTLQDIINNGVDMVLYGGGSRGRSYNRNDYSSSRSSYQTYYSNQQNNYYSKPRLTSGYDYNEIVFQSRADAEAVYYRMFEILNTYQVVRVADYLELSGRDSNYTDNNYGWTALENVQIRRSRDGGYFLDLPKPLALD